MAATVYQIAALLDALCTAVDAAREAAKGDQRWLNAVNSGYDWLLTQDAIEFDAERHELTFVSENATYHANGVCQCKAFAQHNACRHRAAARLVRRALELQQEAAPAPAFQRGQRVRVLATGATAIVTDVFTDRRGPGVAATASNGAIITVYSPHELEALPVAERMTAARAALMECFS